MGPPVRHSTHELGTLQTENQGQAAHDEERFLGGSNLRGKGSVPAEPLQLSFAVVCTDDVSANRVVCLGSFGDEVKAKSFKLRMIVMDALEYA